MDGKIEELEKRIRILEQRRIYQRDIAPMEVKQRHIEGLIIFRGEIADRPSDGTETIQAYFAEDENKLYIWNTSSEAWKSVSLT